MKNRQLTILTGVIAALALAQSAYAIDVNIGGGGGTHVGVGGGVNGGGGVHVGGGVNVGGGGTATRGTANVNVGSTSGTATVGVGSTKSPAATANARVGVKSSKLHATVDLNGDGVIDGKDDSLAALDINGDGILNGRDDVNADGVLNIRDLGPNAKGTVNVGTFKLAKGTASIDLNSGATKKTAHATVDLNGDGIVNSKDDLLVALDVNGDGVLSALDDVNADGILSKVDLGVNIGGLPIGSIKVPDIRVKLPGIGGLNPRQPPPGVVPPPGSNEPIPPTGFLPPPGNGEPLPGGTPGGDSFARALNGIDANDVAALKVKCTNVMGNPGRFDAATIAVCRALASL